MRFIAAALFALAVSACALHAEPDLNPLAELYVLMSLEIGTHEEGYIDAYFGPPEWKTEAEANPREGRISNVSPLGKALIGHKIGDKVTVTAPSGAFQVSVLKVK